MEISYRGFLQLLQLFMNQRRILFGAAFGQKNIIAANPEQAIVQIRLQYFRQNISGNKIEKGDIRVVLQIVGRIGKTFGCLAVICKNGEGDRKSMLFGEGESEMITVDLEALKKEQENSTAQGERG